MATKKQKRIAMQAKREQFMAEVKADGLAALERSREFKRLEREKAYAIVRKLSMRFEERLVEDKKSKFSQALLEMSAK